MADISDLKHLTQFLAVPSSDTVRDKRDYAILPSLVHNHTHFTLLAFENPKVGC